jgi:phenylpropionate dioxygenase-like ring-hydroxylating dioxygenase large terminal subunit
LCDGQKEDMIAVSTFGLHDSNAREKTMPTAEASAPKMLDLGEPLDLRRVGAHPDHWYPVAWSTDLKPGKTLAVRFAGDPIALVRTVTGRLYALEDRCAHRQVPLSNGVVDGETLRCNYHGWTYDCAGACVNIPYVGWGAARLPNGVKAYPVCEVDGLLFVFPGNPALAEARKPSALGMAGDKRYKTRRINREVIAHYTFMHENLMDMNHQFLHRRNMGPVRAKCLDRRQGADWIEVDYTFTRGGGGGQSIGEKVIVKMGRSKQKSTFSDLMTIATRYPYQDLRVWVGREERRQNPALYVWLGYLPLDTAQRTNRTFGYLSVLKPPIPGLIHLAWPFFTWFTERIFKEDKAIVEQEQAAHDAQGQDRNNEIFPVIRDLRTLLARCGERSKT